MPMTNQLSKKKDDRSMNYNQMISSQSQKTNRVKKANGTITQELLNDFIRQKWRQWKNDWVLFATEVFGVVLDPEQAEILRAVQVYPMVSVTSGTSRGKDFVSAIAGLCFMYLTPEFDDLMNMVKNTKVAMTAPTHRQVKNIMQPEFSRNFKAAARRGFPLNGRLVGSDIRTNSEEWFLTAFTADANNEEAWSGFHAANTMFIVTEASGISDKTFEAIEGNLQGNSRILLVFNPNNLTGYAAKSQRGDRWKKFRLNSLNAQNVIAKKEVITGQVNYEWVIDKLTAWCTQITKEQFSDEYDDFVFEGKYYRPEDIFRRKVLGKFPKVSESKLIPESWILAANKRWLEYKDLDNLSSKPLTLGVDVAGNGRDNSLYVKRYQNYVASFKVLNFKLEEIHMAFAGMILNELRQHSNSIAHIDNIGEGAGVYARLIEMLKEWGSGNEGRAYSCKYSHSAKDSEGRELSDYLNQYNFENKRAYLFWAVRDWLDPRNGMNAMLPPNELFLEEAMEIEYFFKSNGKIAIEPKDDIKKRLGRSTDYFDALANSFNSDSKNVLTDNILDYF